MDSLTTAAGNHPAVVQRRNHPDKPPPQAANQPLKQHPPPLSAIANKLFFITNLLKHFPVARQNIFHKPITRLHSTSYVSRGLHIFHLHDRTEQRHPSTGVTILRYFPDRFIITLSFIFETLELTFCQLSTPVTTANATPIATGPNTAQITTCRARVRIFTTIIFPFFNVTDNSFTVS